MTEEINNTGVVQGATQSVENTEEVQLPTSVDENKNSIEPTNSLNQYYWSTDDMPFEPVWVPFKLDHNLYPLVVTAPDPSIKQGKFDWITNTWTDIDNQSTGQKVATLTASVNNIAESVKQLKDDQLTNAKTDKQNQLQMESVQKMLANSNAMTGQISGQMTQFGTALTQLAAAVNKLTDTTDTSTVEAATQSTEAKDGDK